MVSNEWASSNGHNLKYRKYPLNVRKNLFYKGSKMVEWVERLGLYNREVVEPLSWRYSKPNWT